MRANIRTTAIEILKEAGFKSPEKKLGKVSCSIAGIVGIVDVNHLIVIPAGVEKIEVFFDGDKKEIELVGVNKQRVVSDLAKTVIEDNGRESAEMAEKMQLKKAKLKNKTK